MIERLVAEADQENQMPKVLVVGSVSDRGCWFNSLVNNAEINSLLIAGLVSPAQPRGSVERGSFWMGGLLLSRRHCNPEISLLLGTTTADEGKLPSVN